MLSKFQRIRHFHLENKHKIYLPRFVEKQAIKTYPMSRTIKFIWPYMFPQEKSIRKITWATFGLLFASKFLNAYVPFILKEAVNSISLTNPALFYTGSIFVSYALSRALVVAIQELRVALFSRVMINAMKDVSTKVFSHLHALDYTFHQESTRTTLYSVNRSMRGIESYLRFTSLYVLPTILEFLLASGVLFYSCGWPYLVTLGGTVSVYYVFTTKYSDIRNKYISQQRIKSKALDFVTSESMINFETVKYFSNDELEKRRYNYFLQQKLDGNYLITSSLSKLNFGQQLIFNVGLGANLLLALSQVQAGTMTIGDIFMIQTFFMSLQIPLNFLGSIYRELTESQIELNELYELLDIKSKVVESPNAKDYEYKGGRIQIEDVEYSAGKKIFDRINLEIMPGTTNAFIGESGTGKTSLFRLIYRLFDPDQGRIMIDGQDLKDLKLESLRQSVAIVPQTPTLFNDTVFYNVMYGNPAASKEQVIEACKLANIHQRICEFPEGYESLVGELGSKLSGGERQRLALARCLLKNAKFYLLDEFTSAMDSKNEQEILASMKTLFKNKTVIYNTHRLSSIMFVDKIFVISGGKICETGTHDSLLKIPNSKYSQLWNKFISNKN
ncbi:hypothetical protein SteCoe_31469 [Stentor coeruleus]|uniref:Uncharacterized protein n=1 Tax=Stentor coeruleus TaxID=5963 RepID=A0A1R2B1C1_9CILI|nr:hypothetical protein SteCoe_31469 [Stentor coeruleus]